MLVSSVSVQAAPITQQQTVVSTNQERESASLDEFIVDERLNQSAQQKAEHMLANNYWSHDAPNGTTPWVFIEQAGVEYEMAGENLARGFYQVESMVEAWMASPMHRANVLNQSFTHIGIGVATGTLEGIETTVVVAHYARLVSPVVRPVARPAKTEERAAVSVDTVKTVKPNIFESIGQRVYRGWQRLLIVAHSVVQPAQKLLT